MKHLKLYENRNTELWVVTKLSTIGPDDYSLTIFDDKESAENYFVDLVNYTVKEELYYNDDEDKDYIFTVEDAKKAMEEDDINYRIDYNKYTINDKYDLPEKLKLGRDTKKYNI